MKKNLNLALSLLFFTHKSTTFVQSLSLRLSVSIYLALSQLVSHVSEKHRRKDANARRERRVRNDEDDPSQKKKKKKS